MASPQGSTGECPTTVKQPLIITITTLKCKWPLDTKTGNRELKGGRGKGRVRQKGEAGMEVKSGEEGEVFAALREY